LVVLLAVSMVVSALWRFFPQRAVNDALNSASEVLPSWALVCAFWLQPAVAAVVKFGIAAWLFFRTRERFPWLWALLGLVFGLLAVVTYYLVELDRSLKQALEAKHGAGAVGDTHRHE
jgi:hypothetical protein